MGESEFLRIGILSTSGVSVFSILNASRKIKGVVVQAVASRSLKDAERYANRFNIPQAYGSYEEILNLPYIDAVYIPLPNSLHGFWTIKALKAGKNVLCEKPMATSIKEVREIIKTRETSGKILMEAMHYRYHPIIKKMVEVIKSGKIGKVREVRASFCQWIPLWKMQNAILRGKPSEVISSFFNWIPISKNVPYKKQLKEGALWDIGCYCVDALRLIAECDEAEIISAKMEMMPKGIDCETSAEILFANGIRGKIYVSYKHFFPIEIKVKGTDGTLILTFPFMPVISLAGNRNLLISSLWVRRNSIFYPYVIREKEPTYYYQLLAFKEAIFKNKNPVTSAENCFANTQIIEAIIEKATGVKK